MHADENDTTAASVTAVGTNGATGSTATLTNGNVSSISGAHANFTAPGQSVAYNFYASNVGEYIIYGKEMLQSNVEGTNDVISCTIPEGSNATPELVAAACDDISVRFGMGVNGIISDEITAGNITNFFAPPNFTAPVILLIEYAEDGERADGPFNVTFGEITISCSSVPNE